MEPPIEFSNSVRYHMSFIESMHCNKSKIFFLLFSEAVKSFGQTVDWLMSWPETLSVVMREIAGRMSKDRGDPRFAPSQWEMSLHSNAVSHWLGANLESALEDVFVGRSEP